MANCFYCGIEVVKDPKGILPNSATRDHVHPKIKGGERRWHNLVIACKECNGEKGRLSLNEYRAAMAYRHGFFYLGQADRYSFWGERTLLNAAHSVIGLAAKKLWEHIRHHGIYVPKHKIKRVLRKLSPLKTVPRPIATLGEIADLKAKKRPAAAP